MKKSIKKELKKEMAKSRKENKSCKTHCAHAGCGYFLAFLGAAIYYIQTATTFWQGVLGVLKAFVWPAILVHKLMGFLG